VPGRNKKVKTCNADAKSQVSKTLIDRQAARAFLALAVVARLHSGQCYCPFLCTLHVARGMVAASKQGIAQGME